MKKLILALMLVLNSQASNAEFSDWSQEDKVLGIAAAAVTAVDMLQTLDIKRHRAEGIRETNPILGDHPSDAKVLGYFASAAIAGYLIMDNTPPRWRKWFATGVILVEADVVNKNYRLGLRVGF